MAGSMFNPRDLVPNSLRSRPRTKSRVSLAAHRGGRINTNLPLHNLTAYQASFLQNFEEAPPAASLSSNLPLPQDDSYRLMHFNEDHQRAIQALRDVPDDIVLQQLAVTRSEHSSVSHGLDNIPESSPYPFIAVTQPMAPVSEIPPPLTQTMLPPSYPSQPQEPWDGTSQQQLPSNAPSFDTHSSWSCPSSVLTHPSLECPTAATSIHPSTDGTSQASVPEPDSPATANVSSARPISGSSTSVDPFGNSFPAVSGPSNDIIPGRGAIRDLPQLPPKPQIPSASIKYSCTLCDSKATFRGKSEWKRHELSHMPSVEWVCLLEGHIDQNGRCTICGRFHPDIQHVIEHNAHLCLAKDEAARTWVRKDKFVKHLAIHGLSGNCAQVARWSRKLPPRLSGCGFCIRGFNDANERCLHVAKHFESGCDRADWDVSKVILGLLSQPRTALSWQSLLGAAFGGEPAPPVSWSEDFAPEIQRRLEEGQENGHDLALAAFQSSSLCQMAMSGQPSGDQQAGTLQDLNEDTVNRVENLLSANSDTSMYEAAQSWFDDSEPTSDFNGVWNFP